MHTLCRIKGTYTFNLVAKDNTPTTTPNLLQGTTLKKTMEKGTFLATVTETTEAGTTAIISSSVNNTAVSPNKSYLLKNDVGNASQLYLGIKSVITGINSIESNEAEEKVFYNLDGTRADNLQRGRIYITSDGKKVVIK